jgi:hypothetical protein
MATLFSHLEKERLVTDDVSMLELFDIGEIPLQKENMLWI